MHMNRQAIGDGRSNYNKQIKSKREKNKIEKDGLIREQTLSYLLQICSFRRGTF